MSNHQPGTLNPDSEVGEHARLGRCWVRPAPSGLRVRRARTLETFQCARFIFREGAENSARGGRAPFFIFESKLNEQKKLL